ncbi:calcium-transporting ATPase plasma membrane-type-like, partial [Trifolium medium]|nr:calcium-transporting ATPase plasma membrane-type-like [Trifolium medium]
MVLKMCSRYYDGYGNVKDLDDETMSKFENIIQGMAASSLRCIALTYTEVANEDLLGEGDNHNMV